MKRIRESWLVGGLLMLIGLLYFSTLSINHAEAEDAVHYARQAGRGTVRELFHPNHILYNALNRVIYRGWQWAGYEGNAVVPMQVNNVFFALAALLLLYGTVREIGLQRDGGVFCMAALAVSYGFWAYAVEVETYIAPLPFIIVCIRELVLLSRRSFKSGSFVILAVAYAMATLFHQQHVLLLPLIVVTAAAVWWRHRKRVPLRMLIRGVLIFGAVSALLIGAVYLPVGILVAKSSSFPELMAWAAGPNQDTWMPLTLLTPLKSITGAARALWGMHFMFGFGWFEALVTWAFHNKILLEERFLAARMSRLREWSSLLMMLASALSLAALVGWGLSSRQRRTPVRLLRRTGVFAAGLFCVLMILLYGMFNTLWEPQNIEFWIALLPAGYLLLTLFLHARISAGPMKHALQAMIVIGLTFCNLAGSVGPRTHREGDYWYHANRYLIRHAAAEDLILTEGGYISEGYLKLLTRARVLQLHEMSPIEILARISAHTEGRIFVSSWVFDPPAPAEIEQRNDAAYAILLAPLRRTLVRRSANEFQTFWEVRRDELPAMAEVQIAGAQP